MKTGVEFLKENIEKTNIPSEHWENEIGEMMDMYADYYHQSKLKLLNTPVVSKRLILKNLLERMQAVYPEYYLEIIQDELDGLNGC